MRVAFYGMTHLGLVSAVASISRGVEVIAYDPRTDLIDDLKQYRFPIEEPELLDLSKEHAALISYTDDISKLSEADIIYIAIDVPTDSNNFSDLAPIRDAIDRVSQIIHENQLVVILSQVPPGFTRSIASIPKDQLYYQVETLVFGRALKRAIYPERFIVGCAYPAVLPIEYQNYLDLFECSVFLMRYESAELAKISINLYLVSSVTISNLLAELSSEVGADWDEIIPTLQLDKRIGRYAYLNPGLGISGGNLERDVQTVIQQAKARGLPHAIFENYLEASEYYKKWVLRCLKQSILPRYTIQHIAILGLSYKPHTASMKNSPSIDLIKSLELAQSYLIKVHDPLIKSLPDLSVQCCDTIDETIQGADVVILMTYYDAYSDIQLDYMKQKMKQFIIIDPFGLLDHETCLQLDGIVYTLGVNLNKHKEALCSNTYILENQHES